MSKPLQKNDNFKPTNILAGPCPCCGEYQIEYNRHTGEARCVAVTVHALTYPRTYRTQCSWMGRVEGSRLITVSV